MAIPKKVRRTRFDITVSADTLEAIDDYRFATRAPNRVEAVRRLLRASLQDTIRLAPPSFCAQGER